VSKQTVYKNFADKNRLFTEIVLGIADDVGDRFRDMTRARQEMDTSSETCGSSRDATSRR
jgi:AcrR family transcriptional regulator